MLLVWQNTLVSAQKSSCRIEEFLRFIAFHPSFENIEIFSCFSIDDDRNLVCSKRTLNLFFLDDFRTSPTFFRCEHNHRIHRSFHVLAMFCTSLYILNFLHDHVHCRGHFLMCFYDVVDLDKIRIPSTTAQESFQFLTRYSRKDSWIRNFISVQVEDRSQWSRLCFAISDDTTYD